MKRLVTILMGLYILGLSLTGCSDKEDYIAGCPAGKVNAADAIVTGTVKVYRNDEVSLVQRGIEVTEASRQWWPDSMRRVLLWSEEIGDMPVGQKVTLHVKEWSKVQNFYPDSLYAFQVKKHEIVSVAMPQRRGFACAVFEEGGNGTSIMSRTELSEMENITVNVYVHFLLEKDGSGLAASEYASKAQGVVNGLTTNFNRTKIFFKLKDYDGIPIDYSTFSFNKKGSLIELFNRNSHSDGIDLYLTLKSTDITSDDSETMGATLPNQYPSATAAQLNSGISIAHEMGHLFGLYHTHRGTCKTTGDEDDKSGMPEFVDGSNSAIAGDLITDTPADPNKWDAWGRYTGGEVTDSHGDKYTPDPKNIMSYSGDQERFTERQAELMHERITAKLGEIIVRPNVNGPTHFNGIATYTAGGTEQKALYTVVKRYYLPATAEDEEPMCKLETHIGDKFTVSSSGSEYFEITTSYGSDTNYGSTIKATSGAPSPLTGKIWWKSQGKEGFTTNIEHGEALSIYSDNQTMTLDYLDKAGATLKNVNYMIVTASNRVLKGSTIQLSKADCSRGFLKVRMSDACGQSGSYFTIPVEVWGAYYSISFREDGITFESKSGKVSGNGQATETKRPIVSTKVINEKGETVVEVTTEDMNNMTMNFEIKTWPSGNYTAILTDGNGYSQRIPFAI